MAHWSENCNRLSLSAFDMKGVSLNPATESGEANVYLLWLPTNSKEGGYALTQATLDSLCQFCNNLPANAVVCVLASPPYAAFLLPLLQQALKFQLWVAVKGVSNEGIQAESRLPQNHAALLVLTRYSGSLQHTKTRIKYTYCPACKKTTKDYGGKKHTYHEYGTLMSDVWRDLECDPAQNIDAITDRLRDMFGVSPYKSLKVCDLRSGVASVQRAEAIRLAPPSDVHNPALESRLLNADCLEALKTIPDNSIDFCFTDPPYNLQKKYDKWDDALESIAYFEWCDAWLAELYRVLKPGGALAVLNIPLWAARHYQKLATLMQFQSWIVWEALGFPVRMIMPSHYALLCFSKGEPRPLPGLAKEAPSIEQTYLEPLREGYCVRASCEMNRKRVGMDDKDELSDIWSDIHRLKHNSHRVDHPCQLPPLLMRRLIALFTQPNEIILDCFNGAGTSTLVAAQMNRRYIGIEQSEQYHNLAQFRHCQYELGRDPFEKTEAVPQSKNSRVRRMPSQKRAVTKKQLQLDVKRIAGKVGRLPTKEDVKEHSPYSLEYFEMYFASWGEVCAAARTTGMSELPAAQLSLDVF